MKFNLIIVLEASWKQQKQYVATKLSCQLRFGFFLNLFFIHLPEKVATDRKQWPIVTIVWLHFLVASITLEQGSLECTEKLGTGYFLKWNVTSCKVFLRNNLYQVANCFFNSFLLCCGLYLQVRVLLQLHKDVNWLVLSMQVPTVYRACRHTNVKFYFNVRIFLSTF